MIKSLSPSAQKVQDILTELGFSAQVVEMPDSTRTAVDAARACGCTVGQIVKSLIFKTFVSAKPVLVETSGANRVDEQKVAEILGESVLKADAEYVRRVSGYVIGGVAPVGHHEPMIVLIDEDLMQYEEIWAAAGTPHAVFKLTPWELKAMTGGRVAKVKL